MIAKIDRKRPNFLYNLYLLAAKIVCNMHANARICLSVAEQMPALYFEVPLTYKGFGKFAKFTYLKKIIFDLSNFSCEIAKFVT